MDTEITNNKATNRVFEDDDSVPNQCKVTENEACRVLLSRNNSVQQLFSNLVPYFKLQIRISNLLTCIPFEWDGQNQRITVMKSKAKSYFCKLQVILHWIYTLFMMGYFITPGSLKKNDTSTKLLGAVFLSCFWTTMIMRLEIWRNQSIAILMWKSLIDFEKKYLDVSGKTKSRDKISLVLMILEVCTSMGLPGFMFMMLLVDPCKPPHIGYILFKESLQRCAMPSFSIRMLILGFDTWMWAISITSASFYVFQSMFLGLRCLDFYLQLLQRGVKQPLAKIFKTQHQKDELTFKLYNELRLISKLYNKVFQDAFIPSMLAVAIFVIIICLYACIKLHKVIPMPGFAFFPLLSVDGFSVIFIAKIASGVYFQSKRFVTTIRKTDKNSRRSWNRKMGISLDYMKIRFGSNFIDELTPLVFLDFALTQTVSLTLLT